MEKIIDEENKIEFNIEKFLDEDCKEELKVGNKMTFSILSKAWKKGVEEGFKKGFNDGYARGSVFLDNRLQKLSDDYLNRVSDSYHTGYEKGQKDFLKALMWYNKIFLGIDTEYDVEKIKRLYEKYKGE